MPVMAAAEYKQPAAVTIYEDLASRNVRRRSPKKTDAPAAFSAGRSIRSFTHGNRASRRARPRHYQFW